MNSPKQNTKPDAISKELKRFIKKEAKRIHEGGDWWVSKNDDKMDEEFIAIGLAEGFKLMQEFSEWQGNLQAHAKLGILYKGVATMDSERGMFNQTFFGLLKLFLEEKQKEFK